MRPFNMVACAVQVLNCSSYNYDLYQFFAFFPVPCFVVWSIVNTVHWMNGSTQALPFTTILLLGFIWALVNLLQFILLIFKICVYFESYW